MKPIKDLYTWAMSNKLTAALVIVVGYLLFKNFFGPGFGLYRYGQNAMEYGYDYGVSSKMMGQGVANRTFMATDMMGGDVMMEESYAPEAMPMVAYDDGSAANVELQERKVITNTWLTLLVKDVRSTADKISQEADSSGGFTVTKNVYTPVDLPTKLYI